MKTSTLSYINNTLKEYIPYAFMEWKRKPPDTYFTGEYQESGSLEEDGEQDITFILTGFTRGTWLDLERYKQTIEDKIDRTAILDDGTGVAVFYENAYPVPTGDAELKKIHINLKIIEFKNGR